MRKSGLVKSLFIIPICLLLVNTMNAQGSYVNLNVGYAFCMSPATSFIQNYDYNDHSSTQEQIYLSLGKGLNFGGAFGYMFNKHIGAELGLSYLLGGKTEGQSYYDMEVYKGNSRYSLSANMFRFIPSIVVAAGTNKVNPYAKFGLVVGIGSVISEYESNITEIDYATGNEMTNVGEHTIKMNGGVAIGINGAVGALFELSEKISMYGELNAINMSYAPTKGEVIESILNGEDNLPNMSTRGKEIEYVDKYTRDFDNPPPDSESSKQLKQKYPFGSFGINFGVVFQF